MYLIDLKCYTDNDDRKFGKKFKIKISNRKELRKQKRVDKGKRNAERHQKKRPAPAPTQPAKRQKVEEPVKVEPPKKKAATKEKSSAEAMQRLSKSNPGLYKLLKSDNLIESAGDDKSYDDDFADDDRDIAYWEKKLGLNKKKSKNLGKEFEEDGLLDVLGGIEGEDGDDDQEYLRKKRARQAEKKKNAVMEEKAEEAVDDIFAGFDSEEEDDSGEEDVDMEDLLNGEETDEEEIAEEEDSDEEEIDESEDDAVLIDEDDVDSDEEALNEESSEEEVIEEKPKSNVLSKYVPPHLRKTATTKSEQQMKLHKQLQGQLNRLSESNMESILLEIEKCYGTYPRHGKIYCLAIRLYNTKSNSIFIFRRYFNYFRFDFNIYFSKI